MHKTKTILLGTILAIAIFTGIGTAVGSDVNATVGETTPTVTDITLDSNTYDPGTTVTVNVTVTDDAGTDNLDTLTVYAWHTVNGTEGNDKWDSDYTSTTTIDTQKDATTAEYQVSFTLSQHALYTNTSDSSEIWEVGAEAENSYSNIDTLQHASGFDVTKSAGISLSDTALTVSVQPDTTQNQFDQYPVTITHTGNADQDIDINGTNLTSTGTTDEIDVSNLHYNTANDYGASSTLTTSLTSWITNMPRGDASTETAETRDAYYWLDVPPVDAADYTGTITLDVSLA